MSEIAIMDASAVLAYLAEEPGYEVIEAALESGPSEITAVNYCEVLGKLCDKTIPEQEAERLIDALGISSAPFDKILAVRAGALKNLTNKIGASLGDRACLALAQLRHDEGDKPTLYTTEQSWNKIKWPFRIVMIRERHQ